MKRTILFLAFVMVILPVIAQDLSGKWGGVLSISESSKLKVAFNLTKTDTGYSATMDSPDQGALGLPVSSVTFKNDTLVINATNFGIKYVGSLSEGEIKGEFQQGGSKLPLNLKKELAGTVQINRPQEPKGPFPYKSEDIKFDNKAAGATLAGTITLPAGTGKFPIVILISGSGPQDRDEALFGHKPFFLIADYLTRKGIAVLRYDDRGTAASTGDFSKANTLDLASDVSAAMDFLKSRPEIDVKKIGLCGHSEGGLIAPLLASERKDVDFIVLLAGPGMRGCDLLILQQRLVSKSQGLSDEDVIKIGNFNKGAFDIIVNGDLGEKTRAKLIEYFQKRIVDLPKAIRGSVSDEQLINQTVSQLFTPWMTFFLKYDPIPSLTKVKCPVFALNGTKDLQVPAKENLTAIKSALDKGKNKKVLIREYPDLNHLFQNSTTGAPSEYGKIEETMSPQVLEDISAWILKQVF